MTDLDFRLSASEAFELLSLPRVRVGQSLKLGFMGLVAQGILRLATEDRPGFVGTRHIPHLTVADGVPDALPPITGALVKVVRAVAPGGLMKDVVRECHRAFGTNLWGYHENYVGPALVARGLAEKRNFRLLGLIPTHRYERTPAGEAEKIRLENAMREARTIPQFLDRNPAQAAALVAAAGSAVLLVDELKPFYSAISRRLTPSGGSSFVFADAGGFSGVDSGLGNCDFGHVDFSCFDSGAFSSFDAGFSDAGGDGGGDSGGSSGC